MADWAAQGGYAAAYAASSGAMDSGTYVKAVQIAGETQLIAGDSSMEILKKATELGARAGDFDQQFYAEAAPSPGVGSEFVVSAGQGAAGLQIEKNPEWGGGEQAGGIVQGGGVGGLGLLALAFLVLRKR